MRDRRQHPFESACASRRERLRRQLVVLLAQRQVQNRLAITAVARQQLVAALAGQHDLHVLRRELRNEIERHTRRMRDRLVFMPDQLRQRREELFRTDDDFVMIGLESFGDEPRVLELVCFAFRERD